MKLMETKIGTKMIGPRTVFDYLLCLCQEKFNERYKLRNSVIYIKERRPSKEPILELKY